MMQEKRSGVGIADDVERLVRALALMVLTTLSTFSLHVGLLCTARYLAHSSCLLPR